MKRFKDFLRKKFISWLGIDTVYKVMSKNHTYLCSQVNRLERPEALLHDLRDLSNNLNNLHSYFGTCVDIHHGYNPPGSWAVITVGGKKQFMEFVDLSNKDFRELVSFLKRFQGRSRMYDAPYGMRQMIKDMVKK